MDDPGKLLALSSAVALAGPFEDHLVDGAPMVGPELTVGPGGRLRAWSGMRLGSSVWLVLTPGGPRRTEAATVTIELTAPAAGIDPQQPPAPAPPVTACDLTTGTAVPVVSTGSALQISATLPATTVLHVAPGAAPCRRLPLPWLPQL